MTARKHQPADPRFKGETPEKLVKALKKSVKNKEKPVENQ